MPPPPRKKRLISADDLAWKAVPLPSRFEDAEGFYGLEEVDDVDVIRDSKTKRIEFKSAGSKAGTYDTDSEWNGFDDLNEAKTGRAEKSNPPPSLAKRDKEPPVENAKRIVKVIDSSDFTALEDEIEDESADISAWLSLGLSPDILTALSRLKFAKPTPIQLAAIPEALQGHDVIGKASTGSGKTLAYGLPILERLLARQAQMKDSKKALLALVLAPTRELAHQINKHLTELASKLTSASPRFATITGGLSVHKQQRLLKDADIVIGTPGRLWEVMNSEAGFLGCLRQAEFLVVDEADRLLSEGHFKEVEEILNSLDRVDVKSEQDEDPPIPKRQTLVFSATFQKNLQRKLAGKCKSYSSIMSKQESLEYLLKKLNFRDDLPKYIDVNPVSQMASNLREGLVECAANEKDLYLYALLLHHIKKRTLIFTNSISAVRRLAPLLQNLKIQVLALHSQMPQKARLRAIERFGSQVGSVLVATDIAARGLDIPQVQLVVHYNVPRQADTYVHRSGRTARAEKIGASMIICAPDEVVPVQRLVAKIHAQKVAKQDGEVKKARFFIQTLDLDRQVVNRLRPRVDLSKRIADASLAKEKHNSEDSWLKKAAEELGVDYDSEEFAIEDKAKGRKRREKEAEARSTSKDQVARMRAELQAMLAQRVNVGVSERYLTAGGIDIDSLLKSEKGEWLGHVDGLDFI